RVRVTDADRDTTGGTPSGGGTIADGTTSYVAPALAGGVLGKASAYAEFPIKNSQSGQDPRSKLVITAVTPGKGANETLIQLVPISDTTPEAVGYSLSRNTGNVLITLKIHPTTSASDIKALINGTPDINALIQASIPSDIDANQPLVYSFLPPQTKDGQTNS